MESQQSEKEKEKALLINLRIDAMNKAERSDYMSLFNRTCTILGYSIFVSFGVGIYNYILSLPPIAINLFPNQFPRINVWIEYYTYLFPTAMLLMTSSMIQFFLARVVGLGLSGLVSVRGKVLESFVLGLIYFNIIIIILIFTIIIIIIITDQTSSRCTVCPLVLA